MKTSASNSRRAAAAAYFRGKIEAAAADGISLDAMTLHLTLSDVNQLQRDRSLPVEAISFADGVMSYLGVTIVQGGVSVSILSCSGAS